MDKNKLFYILQLAGGTFPSGGFSQSWGLETYVAKGQITNAEQLTEFVTSYLASTTGKCEGVFVKKAHELSQKWQESEIFPLEEMSVAMKLTKESRESTVRMGKAFFRVLGTILSDPDISALQKKTSGFGISYPVAFGLACGKLGLDLKTVLEAFVYGTANGLIQSAVKLVPIGNTEAQDVLIKLQPIMAATVETSLETEFEQASNFCPGLDIASIMHENLSVRLYMS